MSIILGFIFLVVINTVVCLTEQASEKSWTTLNEATGYKTKLGDELLNNDTISEHEATTLSGTHKENVFSDAGKTNDNQSSKSTTAQDSGKEFTRLGSTSNKDNFDGKEKEKTSTTVSSGTTTQKTTTDSPQPKDNESSSPLSDEKGNISKNKSKILPTNSGTIIKKDSLEGDAKGGNQTSNPGDSTHIDKDTNSTNLNQLPFEGKDVTPPSTSEDKTKQNRSKTTENNTKSSTTTGMKSNDFGIAETDKEQSSKTKDTTKNTDQESASSVKTSLPSSGLEVITKQNTTISASPITQKNNSDIDSKGSELPSESGKASDKENKSTNLNQMRLDGKDVPSTSDDKTKQNTSKTTENITKSSAIIGMVANDLGIAGNNKEQSSTTKDATKNTDQESASSAITSVPSSGLEDITKQSTTTSSSLLTQKSSSDVGSKGSELPSESGKASDKENKIINDIINDKEKSTNLNQMRVDGKDVKSSSTSEDKTKQNTSKTTENNTKSSEITGIQSNDLSIAGTDKEQSSKTKDATKNTDQESASSVTTSRPSSVLEDITKQNTTSSSSPVIQKGTSGIDDRGRKLSSESGKARNKDIKSTSFNQMPFDGKQVKAPSASEDKTTQNTSKSTEHNTKSLAITGMEGIAGTDREQSSKTEKSTKNTDQESTNPTKSKTIENSSNTSATNTEPMMEQKDKPRPYIIDVVVVSAEGNERKSKVIELKPSNSSSVYKQINVWMDAPQSLSSSDQNNTLNDGQNAIIEQSAFEVADKSELFTSDDKTIHYGTDDNKQKRRDQSSANLPSLDNIVDDMEDSDIENSQVNAEAGISYITVNDSSSNVTNKGKMRMMQFSADEGHHLHQIYHMDYEGPVQIQLESEYGKSALAIDSSTNNWYVSRGQETEQNQLIRSFMEVTRHGVGTIGMGIKDVMDTFAMITGKVVRMSLQFLNVASRMHGVISNGIFAALRIL